MPTQGFAGFTFTTVDLDEAAHVAVQNAVRDEIAARDPGNARIAWDQLAQLPNLRGMAMPADALIAYVNDTLLNGNADDQEVDGINTANPGLNMTVELSTQRSCYYVDNRHDCKRFFDVWLDALPWIIDVPTPAGSLIGQIRLFVGWSHAPVWSIAASHQHDRSGHPRSAPPA